MSDRLYRIAFDDEPEPTSGLNAAEAQEVEALRQLKGDLAHLRETPDCQLSTAHLRNAILHRSIRPSQRPLTWLWAAVPALACVAGLAIVMAPRPETPEGLVAAEVVRSAPLERVAQATDRPADPPPVTTATQTPAVTTVAPERPRVQRRTRFVRSAGELVASRTDGPPVIALTAPALRSEATEAPAAYADAVVTEPEPEPVIVVYDANDQRTGVQIATERPDAQLVAGF